MKAKKNLPNHPAYSAQHLTDALEHLEDYLNLLDSLACTLASERLRLIHQVEQLAEAQSRSENEHANKLQELDARSRQLKETERSLEHRTVLLRKQQSEAHQAGQTLESGQARLTIQAANWKGERERLHVQIHSLEEQAARLSEIIDELPADCKDQLSQPNLDVIEKHRIARAEADYALLRHELNNLRGQRASYEQQVAELSAEVERLAAILLEENDPHPIPIAKAA